MSVRRCLSIVSAGLLVVVSLSLESSAQVSASIGGTVSDPTGALIPGVEVAATNVNTGITTTQVTNEAGAYQIPSVQPGSYRLKASLPGFQAATRENIQLSQGQQVRFNFTLQVGSVATAVEVLTDSASSLATTTATVGDVLPETEVRSLPLATRNVIDLAFVTAGTVGENFGGARMSQINTTRDGLPTGDGRYLDWNGAYSGTFTSPDLVEEVQVNVTSVDAAVGRGSGQVRLQTRSGTNQFHGALFYADENSKFAANNWFQNLAGTPKNYVNRNQFGGRLGGPIIHDKAFFFFLFDGQRYLTKEETIGTVLTPQARQGIFRYLTSGAPGNAGGVSRRNGSAFSTTKSVDLQGNVLTADPATGSPLFLNSFNLFSDVKDPFRTGIDPVWIGPQYLRRMPMPNDWTVGDGLNTAGIRWKRRDAGLDGATGDTQTTNRNQYNMRFDYQINNRNKVSYSLTRENDWGVTGQTGLPDWPGGYFGVIQRDPTFSTASWVATISPTLVNEFRWGRKVDTWVGMQPTDLNCCNGGVFDTSKLSGIAKEAFNAFPQIDGQRYAILQDTTIGGDFARARQNPRFNSSPLMQFANTLSWTRRSHSFQGGFEATYSSSGQIDAINSRPTANLGIGTVPISGITTTNFRGLNTNDVNPAQVLLANLAGSIDTLAQDFFLLSPTEKDFRGFQNGGVLKNRAYHQNDYAAFFKDSWKVRSNLTLNLGLRYDLYGTPYDSTGMGVKPIGGQAALFGISGRNFGARFQPGAAGGSPTIIGFAGKDSPNGGTPIYNNDLNNFAPSIGFSWNVPRLTRSTVVRGGYGVNYTGAPTFLQYSTVIAGAPGSSLSISRAPGLLVPSQYLDIASSMAPGIFPLPTGGIRPLDPVPVTNRVTGLQAYADNRVVPYVQNWNLSVQRELVNNLTVEVRYVGTKGSKLRSAKELNTINIFENGILDAFKVTQAGGNAPLFDAMLKGIQIGTITVGSNGSGSEALRQFATTNQWIANGEVANLANFLNSSSTGTGEAGGLLRRNGLPENFIVVNPQFGSVQLHGNDDNSTYHSLQTSVRKRLSHGLSGEFNYTWSRAIGNSAAGNVNGTGDTTTSERDPRNRDLQKGLLIFHRTNVVKGHGGWDLPFGPNRLLLASAPSMVQRIVEGWNVSGIFSWNSGQPLSITTTRRTLDSRANINSPDLVGVLPKGIGNVSKGAGFVEYFNGLSTHLAPVPTFGGNATVAGRFTNQVVVDKSGNIILQNPEAGTAGNLGLALSGIEGPGRLGLDMALQKRTRLTERTTFTIRADAVNVLNRPMWDVPNTDINSTTFGRITTATGARTVVINARVDF
jgi:Carboxypeptidase regulatory-like domain/TonB dependent receptor-like, beta-barrel